MLRCSILLLGFTVCIGCAGDTSEQTTDFETAIRQIVAEYAPRALEDGDGGRLVLELAELIESSEFDDDAFQRAGGDALLAELRAETSLGALEFNGYDIYDIEEEYPIGARWRTVMEFLIARMQQGETVETFDHLLHLAQLFAQRPNYHFVGTAVAAESLDALKSMAEPGSLTVEDRRALAAIMDRHLPHPSIVYQIKVDRLWTHALIDAAHDEEGRLIIEEFERQVWGETTGRFGDLRPEALATHDETVRRFDAYNDDCLEIVQTTSGDRSTRLERLKTMTERDLDDRFIYLDFVLPLYHIFVKRKDALIAKTAEARLILEQGPKARTDLSP